MVAAVLKDTLLIGLLGGVGLFRAPLLIGIDVAIIAALWLPPVARHVRPLTAFGGWRDAVGSIGSIPVAALVAIVWAGPVVLQLASPVVPFIDVLPNYVGPVEHLRTFGWFSPLTATQSPIIGPSRTVLGYDGLLGSLATMTNLSGALAIAGFILPQTILVAAGAHRLATALRRGDAPIGPWALIAFALSQSFARLADARGTVVVVPLVCLGLALAAEALRDPEDDPWRIGRGAVIGLALGSATLVHPVIGFFAIVTVGIVGLWRPRELAATALVAGLTAGLIALPQLATMVGLSLPRWPSGSACRSPSRSESAPAGTWRGTKPHTPRSCGSRSSGAWSCCWSPSAASACVRRRRVQSRAGAGCSRVGRVAGPRIERPAPDRARGRGCSRKSRRTLADRRYRSPRRRRRRADYADPSRQPRVPRRRPALRGPEDRPLLAVHDRRGGCRGGPRPHLVDRPGSWFVGSAAIGAFVAVAAFPLRFGQSGDDSRCKSDCASINAAHLGEHRSPRRSRSTSTTPPAGTGSASRIRAPSSTNHGREILDAIRAEIDAGRLAHDTPVLHLARSFQQWVATPLGVFDGVNETFVSLDPEVSHQTVGGRLFGLEQLPADLASKGLPVRRARTEQPPRRDARPDHRGRVRLDLRERPGRGVRARELTDGRRWYRRGMVQDAPRDRPSACPPTLAGQRLLPAPKS